MTSNQAGNADPHREAPVLEAGPPLREAHGALVMLHGRGASATGMLAFAEALRRPTFAIRAPQASHHTWYPARFIAPLERNEPWLGSALAAVNRVLETLERDGMAPGRVVLFGFSQGACLAAEYVARRARRYGGLVVLAGGLIGPEGTPRDYAGSLEGTPVFIGCGELDDHIPVERARETADVLRQLGGEVTLRLYPGVGHEVAPDEIEQARQILDALAP